MVAVIHSLTCSFSLFYYDIILKKHGTCFVVCMYVCWEVWFVCIARGFLIFKWAKNGRQRRTRIGNGSYSNVRIFTVFFWFSSLLLDFYCSSFIILFFYTYIYLYMHQGYSKYDRMPIKTTKQYITNNCLLSIYKRTSIFQERCTKKKKHFQ